MLHPLLIPVGSSSHEFTAGIFLVDKPKDWTSFDVVAKMRRILRIKKIGHAGTLDPMATGLLIVCVERAATSQIDTFMGMEKEYTGTLRLGETTESYDAESDIIKRISADHLSFEEVKRASLEFCGEILQKPPMYSAIKIGGERLYKKARRGEQVEVPERSVTIHEFEVSEKDGNDVHFRVRCSKGTYIRSLAHDLGQVLGVGAHLIALRRTAIGPFKVMDAWAMPQLLTLQRPIT
ncbi:MAG: tRNA pseudouridine(55) synthase TruB [Rhodothermia bacterium]|nr:tRNA pseudouridine(55) synthase TruB [Rhodothermia bacterium]